MCYLNIINYTIIVNKYINLKNNCKMNKDNEKSCESNSSISRVYLSYFNKKKIHKYIEIL